MLAAPASAADVRTATPRAQRLSLLDGGLELDLAQEIVLGDPAAPHPVVLFYDPNCPHCRHAHAELDDLRSRRPDVVVVLLPTPLPTLCNRFGVSAVGPRFADSCELARITLALHAVAPRQSAEFDRWLFAGSSSDHAPTADAALDRARSLAGDGGALDAALRSDAVDDALFRNTQAWGEAGFGSVPVLVSPGRPPLYPRMSDTADDLAAWLDDDDADAE